MSQSIPFVRSHFFILCSIISVLVDVQCFAQCKGIRDNLGFWIPRCGLRIPGTGFQSLSVELGFWIPIIGAIPDSLSCIPDSKTQDSGFQKQKFAGFRIPDSLTWGEMFDVLSLTNHEDDVSGRKLPSKISLRSFKLYRVHSSQDCLLVPNCLLCVFTFSIQRRRRKFYVVVVQWSSIPKCTKQNGMLLQLLFLFL